MKRKKQNLDNHSAMIGHIVQVRSPGNVFKVGLVLNVVSLKTEDDYVHHGAPKLFNLAERQKGQYYKYFILVDGQTRGYYQPSWCLSFKRV